MDLDYLYALSGRWRESNILPIVVVSVYPLAAVVLFPVTLLVLLTAFLFEPVQALACASLGVVLSGLVGWTVGHSFSGRQHISLLTRGHAHRVGAILSRYGVLSVAVIRHIPIAPFTVVNIVIGSAGVTLGQFVLGTLVGMLPGIVAITLFEQGVKQLIHNPSLTNILLLVALALFLVGAALAFDRILRSRAGIEDDDDSKFLSN